MIHRFRRLRRLGIKLLNLRNPRNLRMTVPLSEFLHPCMPPRGMGILSMTPVGPIAERRSLIAYGNSQGRNTLRIGL